MCSFKSQEYGVFCNGALHSFALSKSGRSSSTSKVVVTPEVLVALDITDEITREILQPDDSEVVNYTYRHIGVLDGCLCVLLGNPVIGFEIWVIKDYLKRESWSKRYTISHKITDNSRYLKPMWSSHTEETAVSCRGIR